ncbi:glycosyltransferase family 4 protein [Flavobacterium sp. SORGH_AS_0622]|jgi:glycosyltransferase involved in cell wall biosynthesis|uniref:glycosyltransferase family 4 protein n=1 Tax=Flavobacterium sp. SORGH_AS_0622 TaxID=3041772 RepID=UPI00277DAC21|nr:glycosyltransferase family 4 protein [Flavobacterium sp. SORGH_AS_0622]MDQ1167512.1 glycosyltransferase involved in cell wall biosynthesis [Flavobacterium sp. SORGH_AS_0622]
MKILHTVESYDPASHGMQQVVKQLSERLVKAGHSVTVATRFDSNRKSLNINGVEIVEFKISGKDVTGYNADNLEIERYKNFLLNSDFDVITNFAAQQWATDIALPILDKIKAVKVFVPTGFSELNNPKYSSYFESMKTWMKNYDMNFFLSNDYQDINFARTIGVQNIKIIPNGASAEEFVKDGSINIKKKLGIPEEHSLILHVGSHTGLKGHKEAIKIFKKARIKKTTLLIVGNSTHNDSKLNYLLKFILKYTANLFSNVTGKSFFPACYISCTFNSFINKISFDKIFNKKQLLVKNLSRKDTVAAYMEADVFLFPSNIECSPLVLFECMASKTPFLATNVGNVKEIIGWCHSGQLLPTLLLYNGLKIAELNESADVLMKFISDKKMLEEYANDGFSIFIEKYTWEKIAMQYECFYAESLKK